MDMTLAQQATLRAHILASTDPAVIAARAIRNDTELARLYNLDVSPAWWLYKSTLSRHDLLTGTSPDGTTFTWGGTSGGYINRSQGERDAFREMFNSTGSVNPAQANIQTAFNDIFSGAGAGAVANRAHILAMSRRRATVFERVFATGTGTTGSPGLLVLEGPVNYEQIGVVMNG